MLKFGTSGLRGLVSELTDRACYSYTLAYLQYLSDKKLIKKGSSVAMAGDFRPSTRRILTACVKAIGDFGLKPDFCGIIPTQAVSLYGFKRNLPSIMITGSHIPYDRNGIKFNLPDGEILKKDEQAIVKYQLQISTGSNYDNLFNKKGLFIKQPAILLKINMLAKSEYIKRYLTFFGKNFLKNKKIVIYEHSAVIRDIMAKILKKMGAKVISVGRSEKFVPIDTEAVSEADLKNARRWARKYKPNAIISADGDSDRPMLFDELGNFIRGDFLDVISAAYLRADSVSATASCNTVLEKCRKFKKINRTKIGSPYVVEAMQKDKKKGYKRIVSYEANGGFLTGSDINLNGQKLRALPTRDSMLPLLSAIGMTKKHNRPLSRLKEIFPERFVYSQSIKGFPTETSQALLKKISKNNSVSKKTAKEIFGLPVEIERINFLDSTRMYLSDGDILHVRPSGNSPELRVYCESDTLEKARDLTEQTLKKLKQLNK